MTSKPSPGSPLTRRVHETVGEEVSDTEIGAARGDDAPTNNSEAARAGVLHAEFGTAEMETAAMEAAATTIGPGIPELLLYLGNACNRDCFFCCIEGSPDGWYGEFDAEAPARILALIRPDARIKLYGGEPTLSHGHVVWLIGELRAAGYRGRLTVFSNGIQADHLISILDADPPTPSHPGSDCYLNPHIWEGRGVEPIPPSRRLMLERWAADHPARLWLSHDDLLPVGSGACGTDTSATTAPEPAAELPVLRDAPFGGHCARCWPTVLSDNRIHACAFAAEEKSPRYILGHLGETSAADLVDARRQFLRWIDDEVEPTAEREGVLPCEVCVRSARAMTEKAAPDTFLTR